jgi:dihydroorotase
VSKTFTIKNALFVQPEHSLHLKHADIIIEDGKVKSIGESVATEGEEITGEQLVVSSGWCDLKTHLTDPGNEHKDTVASLLETAANGGFTAITTTPDTNPPIADKSAVNYVLKSAEHHLVDLYPTGRIAALNEEENLAELFDMYQAGALAFSNGEAKVSNGLLLKALRYTRPFKAPVLVQPLDRSIHKGGTVNESVNTIHTGLKTSPALAEYISVKQHLEIARYCDAPLHFSSISTAEAVKLIQEAQDEGMQVTCDTTIFNLCFTDEQVLTFNENFKLNPLLRTERDRKALVQGLNNGVIQAISSNHHPQNEESKQVEFDYADTGALSLQFVLAWYYQYLQQDLDITTLVNALTAGPRAILGLSNSSIQEGEKANLVVFDAEKKWTFNEKSNKSISKNTHLWQKELKGKAIAIFNNQKHSIL